jgi:Family of unknown function (DUF5906)/Bifunctional DNA primase/polymerase, N-terminal
MTLEVALDYLSRGWQPIPDEFRGKRPTVGEGWTEFQCDAESAAQYFDGSPQNIGVLLGTPSGGLVDVDIDDPFARTLAPRFLPPTGATFGREGNPSSHWLYISSDATTKKFVRPDGNTALVEIRSTGAQTVFPGSVHESGERVEWVSDGIPATIEASVLQSAVGRLAAAALIASLLTSDGMRDDVAAALTGILRRTWSAEDVREFIGAIAHGAGDEEAAMRERKIDRQPQREFGWPTLRDRLGNEVVNRVAEWLDLASESVIEDLNGEFAVVPVGGKVVILRETADREYPGTMAVEYWRQQDFHLKLANRLVRVGEDDVAVSKVWVKSTRRREYEGVVFEPGVADTNGYFNLWRQWGVSPKKGSWKQLYAHICENVADHDERAADWLIAFMADAIQHPNRPAGVSVVLQGDQGVGKGIVWNSFGALFGRHFIHVTDPRHVVGNFNSHLADKLLIFVDEGFFAGDRRHAAVLKGMITEPRVIIEPKGINAFSIPNYRRVVFASNEDWVVPAGLDERRFAVFRVNGRRSQDRKYFGAIIDELKGGGYEALMYDLMHFDLSTANVAKIPKTAALWDQKRLTFDAATTFWFEQLLAGVPIPGRTWEEKVPVAEMVSVFGKTISNAYERRALETKLGVALKRLCPELRVVRTKSFGHRERLYVFPSLEECREAFESAVHFEINWGNGEAKAD